MIYFGRRLNKSANNSSAISLDDIVSELRTQGYTIESVVSSGSPITGISLDKSTISISTNGTSTITVSYGSYIATCSANVVIMPTDTSVPDGTTTFSTQYGKIDVICLSGTGNNVSNTPNAPNLSGMTPVSWTKSGDTWAEDVTASASYYSYIAGSENDDNTSSRWANAKNSDGSYFVWIPRYAYRITYIICAYGKIGDTTKEVYKDGIHSTTFTKKYSNVNTNWFSNTPYICTSSNPFFMHGGYHDNYTGCGVFASSNRTGVSDNAISFRTVLCP